MLDIVTLMLELHQQTRRSNVGSSDLQGQRMNHRAHTSVGHRVCGKAEVPVCQSSVG